MFSDGAFAAIGANKTKYWVGEYPPTDSYFSSTNLYDPMSLYREQPVHHGTYDTVQIIEFDIGSVSYWKLILIEAVSLLKRGLDTALTLQFRESEYLTIFALASFMTQKWNIAIQSFDQSVSADRVFTISIVLRRLDSVTTSSVDFCMVTDGTRDANVQAFLDSVRANQIHAVQKIAVYICGPEDSVNKLETHGLDVHHVEPPHQFLEKGWITKKKNLLVESATADTLVILHDRYTLDKDFLWNLDAYGWDFEVLVPYQRTTEGKRFPDWVSTSSLWTWTPSLLLEAHEYNEFVYVNGGAIIAKRSVLLECPWNEMLFWNQGEDVELSRRMAFKSIVPRYADTVQLNVLQYRDGYIASFEKSSRHLKNARGQYPGLLSRILQSNLIGEIFRLPVVQKIAKSRLAADLQKTSPGAWVARRLVGHSK